MQELAKSLEVLGITSLEGLTKKELKKVECVGKIIHTVVDINTINLSLLKYFFYDIITAGFQEEIANPVAREAPSFAERPFEI